MERLDGRVQLVWAISAVVVGLLLGGLGLAVRAVTGIGPDWWPAALGLGVGVVGTLITYLRYRVWGFAFEDDALYLERGVFTRVETTVPYVRVQHVDTRRGPLDRIVGLGNVVVYTAGTRGADITLPGLALERARALRERLRDRSIESEFDDGV